MGATLPFTARLVEEDGRYTDVALYANGKLTLKDATEWIRTKLSSKELGLPPVRIELWPQPGWFYG
jgi:hypothetical protein